MFLPGYPLHIYGKDIHTLVELKGHCFSMTMWQEQIDANHQSKNVSDWFRELFSKLYQRIQLKEVQKRSKGFSL